MNTSRQRLLHLVLTAIPVLLVVASGVMKLLHAPNVVEALNSAGVGAYIVPLGLMELAFAALFALPRTLKLGTFLLTAYFAGAIATDLSHHHPIVAPVVILTLVWIVAFVRDRSVFLPAADEAAHPAAV